MTKRSKEKRTLSELPRKAGRQRVFGVIAIVGIIAVIALGLAWARIRQNNGSPTSTNLPGPSGGPSIAQDVDTRIGKRAPSLTLLDSEGRSYTIAPGRGRPLVLVFHMGMT